MYRIIKIGMDVHSKNYTLCAMEPMIGEEDRIFANIQVTADYKNILMFIEQLEPVLRDAGQEMWQALDRIISAKNAMEGIVAKEMYIRGFLDYERLVCEKDNHI